MNSLQHIYLLIGVALLTKRGKDRGERTISCLLGFDPGKRMHGYEELEGMLKTVHLIRKFL